LRIIFTVRDPSWKVSLAFSLGLFIGISPFLGLHTVLALLLAHLLRLNKIVTLSGAYVTNPWTIVPIYTFSTWVGVKITGYEGVIISDINFRELTLGNIASLLRDLLVPFFIGTLFTAMVTAFVAYFMVLYLLRKFRDE
ncbi:MAG: DUF2062 domain-containing protein, partial [Nitrospirae bacterium]